jgi:hypothetical protein
MGVTKAVHAPENSPRRMAYDIVPARSFTAIIDREIIPVPMVHAIPRLNTPNLCASAPFIVRPKKLEALRIES